MKRIWDRLIPKKVRFPCRQKLKYWQDHSSKAGALPPDTVFHTESIGDNMVTLRGIGYGHRPEYGNGAITMRCEDVMIHGEEVT